MKNHILLTPKEKNSQEVINSVKSYITKNKCNYMTIDISSMNLLNASKVVALCSTSHYIKYPQGNINWIVNSKEVESMVKPLVLSNTNFAIAR